jgi:predicted  nucleic acid-binding Zn-ribbon protein
MSTAQVAAALFQLQQIDLELERLSAEQQSITQSLQENAQVRKLRSEERTAQQQLQSALQAQKEAEWTLEDLTRRLNVQEQRLYSGAVTNPKELHAVQQEVENLRGQRSRQEDKTLEIMDTVESLEESVRQKMEALKQAEAFWTQESAVLVLRREQLEERTRSTQEKRTQQASRIDAAILDRYNTMRRSKQGRAVSKVEQNSCQWCRVILTPSELQRVRVSSELQTCTNCGRILYYDR